jgi:hypothetical protein
MWAAARRPWSTLWFGEISRLHVFKVRYLVLNHRGIGYAKMCRTQTSRALASDFGSIPRFEFNLRV